MNGRVCPAALYVLSQRYGILPIYKPPTHSVKESRHYSTSARQPLRPCIIIVLRCHSFWNVAGRMDNACTFPGHLLTVEMLVSLARDGCSNDSTSHENSAIHSWMLARLRSSAKSCICATRPRGYRTDSAASPGQARLAKHCFRANP